MTNAFEITPTAKQLAPILATKGKLDSKASQTFKTRSEEALGKEAKQITINFRNLERLDSSAAGMLMFFNYAAKTKGKEISIVDASPAVQAVLNRANLGKLVSIK
jgi:anti-anti-sigma factor